MPQREYPDMVRSLLLERQEGACPVCAGRVDDGRAVEIHHVDGNPKNQAATNLDLRHEECHPHPGRPRLPGNDAVKRVRPPVNVDVCVEGVRGSVERRIALGYADADAPPQMRVSAEAKPRFQAWIQDQVGEHGSFPEEEAINSGAYLMDVDVETTRRWLKPLKSALGPFRGERIDGQWVLLPRSPESTAP